MPTVDKINELKQLIIDSIPNQYDMMELDYGKGMILNEKYL